MGIAMELPMTAHANKGNFALTAAVALLSGCNERVQMAEDHPALSTELADELHPIDSCERRLRRAPRLHPNQPDFQLHEGWHLETSVGPYLDAVWLTGEEKSEVSETPLSLNIEFIVVPQATWLLEWPYLSTSRGPKEVTFGHGFAISKELVSVGTWRQCEADCYCPLRSSDDQSDDQSMVGVSWEDVRTFNFWLQMRLPQDKLFRHPSAAEWMVLQQIRPDLIQDANPEWVGDCANSPEDRVLQDGTAMDWSNGPCRSHMLLVAQPDSVGSWLPYARNHSSRVTPLAEAGFRIARDFDIEEIEIP